ncbi:hypothetical protein IDH45_22665 [Paenibacillus sp. IB182363]|uniref:Uncharacterized protein n=1 Tax=Paenibacillus oceani TaxID=2772510 RepID=A0A927CDP9_9BACL|nr:hypothetical protein [Paenibacillus oceani]
MMEDFNPMYNPYVLLNQKAANESAKYIEENMKDAIIIPMKTWGEKLRVLDHTLKYIPQNSFIVECVYILEYPLILWQIVFPTQNYLGSIHMKDCQKTIMDIFGKSNLQDKHSRSEIKRNTL